MRISCFQVQMDAMENTVEARRLAKVGQSRSRLPSVCCGGVHDVYMFHSMALAH